MFVLRSFPPAAADHSHEAQAAATTAVFVLEDTDATRADWPHRFRLEYTVVLGPRTLRTALHVANRNDADAFTFTTALHTYFAVRRIEDVRVVGLHGLRYTDKMRNAAQVRARVDALQGRLCQPRCADARIVHVHRHRPNLVYGGP